MKNASSLFKIFQSPLSQEEDLREQRERILYNILLGMCVLGFLLLAVKIPEGLQQKRYLTLVGFGAIYISVLVATFIRKIPFHVRVFILMAVMYLLGTITLVEDGLLGNGRLYLLAFTVIAGILLGVRGGVMALVMSLLTLVTFWVLTIFKVIAPAPVFDTNVFLDTKTWLFWVVAMVAFLAIAATVTISMATLVRSLEESLRQARGLSTELQSERSQLEKNVADQTADLQRRLIQIRTAAEITNTLGSFLDPLTLMKQVVDLVRERFNLYYVGIFLVDEANEYAVLAAGTGEAGQKMVAEKHRLAIGSSSMIGWTVSNRQARIALDVGTEAVRFSNPYLPQTRSELALPLIANDRVLGAMTVQSTIEKAFDQDDITVLQGIVDSVATALENARLFQELGTRLEEIRSLHQQYLTQAWTETSRRSGELVYTFEAAQTGQEQSQSTMDIPLTLREQSIGRVVIDSDRLSWSPEEKSFIESVASEAAVALENARLLQETQRRAEREQIVTDIAGKVRTYTEIETVLKTAIREVGQVMRASGGMIVLHSTFEETAEGGSDGAIPNA